MGSLTWKSMQRIKGCAEEYFRKLELDLCFFGGDNWAMEEPSFIFCNKINHPLCLAAEFLKN